MVHSEFPQYPVFEKRITKVEKFSLDDVIQYPSGIDLREDPIYKGSAIVSQYETGCFQQLATESKDLFLLGPHIMDYLSKIPDSKFAGQPDAMAFSQNQTAWTLRGLYEFKIGRNRHVVKKAKRFASLLTCLQEDPEYLPNILATIFPSSLPTPKAVDIPFGEDVPYEDRIRVTFITPKIGDGEGLSREGFPIYYRSLPLAQ
jgi:hypothetical protein